VTALALVALLLAAGGGAAPKAPEPPDCDALYYGRGRPRDYGGALACYRADGEWLMVAIMQLNGDGTPVDVAAARKSLAAYEDDDMDREALDRIIKKREADPKAKGPRVDFCRDVALTTLSSNWCQSWREARAKGVVDARLKELRSRLEAAARPPFDRTLAAFAEFVDAEAERAYQLAVTGSIRNEFAMDQAKLARDHFSATMKILTADRAAVPTAPRPFVDVDRELNAVYRDLERSRAEDYERDARELKDAEVKAQYRGYAADYRIKSRDAQRAWLRYRDAAAKLAATRWPQAPGIEDVVRALVTEGRIRELRNDVGP
jgi:hypothetical protein